MTTQEVKRKLTAILSADVKGYSRLMGEDEEGTLHTLTAYREVMAALIKKHQGRVVNAPGDALLAEFESVVDAVKSAVEIQRELAKQNAELTADRRMEYRIGINLGDVMVDGEAIYGDGVNIAARLESLSEAGGIRISGTAYDQVKNKLPLGYEYLGEHIVKNIAEPVRTYRVLMGSEAVGKVIGEKKAKPRKWQKMALIATAILIVIIAAVAIWKLYIKPTPPTEVASKERMVFPLPDKPSIAVLPFANMSGNPEQEYFCDGLTEEIINSLSKIQHIIVIARNSTFTYKGKSVKVQQVAEEMGVRYVLEGSVRREGNRVRITAQLIDAISGHHLFSERYERDLKEIFVLQDEITMKIIVALQVELTDGEKTRLYAKGTNNLEAYLKFLQGNEYRLRLNRGDNVLGRQLCEEAIGLDPKYLMPYVALGWTHMMDWRHGWSESPQRSMDRALELAQKALAMDETYAPVHVLLVYIYRNKGEYEKAIAEGERAISLDPNFADAYRHLAGVLCYVGRPEEAIASLEKGLRLEPIPPAFYFYYFGLAYWMMGRYEEAITNYKKALDRAPKYELAQIGLTASYSSAGREEEARAQAAEVLRVNPKCSLEHLAKTIPYKNPVYKERFIDALRKAGLK
jgi:adenylate cyclase